MGPLALLRRYAAVAREEIRRDFAPDSCVVSTRITLAVFKRFGIRGQPMPAELLVQNDQHAILMQAERPDEVGHVVAWLGKSWLVDASLDQAERPAKDLYLPAVFYCAAPRFPRRAVSGTLAIDGREVRLIYEARPHWKAFETAPDWLEPWRWGPVVERILRRM